MSLEPLSPQSPLALPSILLVEDHDDSRDVDALGLQDAGFSVQQAGSGEEALESLLERVPDVLVTDVSLPGMSGIALCRHVRRLSIAKRIKVLALAPPADIPEELEETISAGFDAVLVKPCLPVEFVGAVRRLLERGHELRHRSSVVRAKAVQRTQRSNRLHLQSRVFLAAAGINGVVVSCPGCRQPIAWRETNRINQIRFDYFQPCAHGCGQYLFDHLRRRFVKLRS